MIMRLSEDNKIHIFHHNDMDGRISAAVMYEYLSRYETEYFGISLCEVDYSVKLDFCNIPAGDLIVFVDYSFTGKHNTYAFLDLINDNKHKIIWIDHHISSFKLQYNIIRKYREENSIPNNKPKYCYKNNCSLSVLEYSDSRLDIYLDTQYSAAYLAYMYCFNKVNNENEYVSDLLHGPNIDFNYDHGIDIPLTIKYVDSYDTWKMNIPCTIEFKYGSKEFEGWNIPTIFKHFCKDPYIMFDKEHTDFNDGELGIINTMLDIGRIIKDYVDIDNDRNKNSSMFEFSIIDDTIEGNGKLYRCAAINRSGNSLIFGEDFEYYDICCPFYYTSKGLWKYSFFSCHEYDSFFNNSKNCADLASILGSMNKIGAGGGGHACAAGFHMKNNILKSECIIKLSTPRFKKDKIKVEIV